MPVTRRLIQHAVVCMLALNPPSVAAQAPAGPVNAPRFDRVLLLESSSETSANVSIGDVNGDGNLDLVLAKGRHWPLVDRVLLGDGRGKVLSAYNLSDTSDRSYSGLLVDLNGDRALDVVISNDAPALWSMTRATSAPSSISAKSRIGSPWPRPPG